MLRSRFIPRDDIIIFRVTSDEKSTIQNKAGENHTTISEYLRDVSISPPDHTYRDLTYKILQCSHQYKTVENHMKAINRYRYYRTECKFGDEDDIIDALLQDIITSVEELGRRLIDVTDIIRAPIQDGNTQERDSICH